MKDNLNIAIIQSDIIWENIDENLIMFSEKIEKINNADIIVLPEMFNTGFSMNSKLLAESTNSKSVNWLKEIAKNKNSVIVASLIIKEKDNYYNRLFWIEPNGTYKYYNKRHLFRMANEHNYYTHGTDELIINYKGWRIKPLICYDLRFPVWSRNKNNYDLLIYVANWPERRAEPWKILLKARAIENQAYVVGVNRVGTDGNGVVFSGDSAAIDPYGKIISNINPHEDKFEIIKINLSELNNFREKFPVNLDADSYKIS